MTFSTFQSRRKCHFTPWLVIGVLCVAMIAFAPTPAPAQETSLAAANETVQLTDQDFTDIARIEEYLNTITTLKSRFIQMASTGETSEGDFLLWRPGRLRIAYDPPSPVIIKADGMFLVYHDTELDQMTHVPLASTPAGVLVEERVVLNGEDLAVTGVRRGANTLDVSIIQRDDPYAGRITLVFTDRPLRLQRWVVLDAQGITTNFALVGSQTGVTLDPELFKSVMPLQPNIK